ncbi:uncharacterized protein LOC131234603 [Magnolia sinica]|uniref:uncharacterized protein LOC131234603 n=1 Tax=Magnolia sinica TaxID=86752 RepID=UPI00265A2C06|nr:uncharacterized protein LOC131234603 [Magnolia sinica]
MEMGLYCRSYCPVSGYFDLRYTHIISHKNLFIPAACSALTLKSSSIVLFFSNGINEIVAQQLQDEFGASEFQAEFSLPNSSIFTELEEEWVYVTVRGKPSAFQLNIDCIEKSELSLDHGMKDPVMGAANLEPTENHEGFISTDAFSSLISTMRSNFMGVVAAKPEAILGENLINFDTTALVALVSGISNGGAELLLAATESEMIKLFKNNVKFVMAQVMSELQNPILGELRGVLSCKRGVIRESVLSELKEVSSVKIGKRDLIRSHRNIATVIIHRTTVVVGAEPISVAKSTYRYSYSYKIISYGQYP